MTNKLSTRFTRAKYIYQREGLGSLIKRTFVFLLSWLSYAKYTFYIYEVILEHRNEADFMPKVQDVTFKIVETNQQLYELSNNGFDLSLLDITEASQRLEEGAIAAFIFIGHELAYKGWTAMTEEAKNTFNRYPYKVDFSNNEACSGDAWTNPKYRRLGLHKYAIYRRREYLLAKGIKKTRQLILSSNIASISAEDKIEGSRSYAKARYLRIGRLKFWKETPIKLTKNND